MKKRKSESEIVDTFLDDLARDYTAPTPPELDDTTATFLRALSEEALNDLPDEDVQERLWNQILFMIHCGANVSEDVPLTEPAESPVRRPAEVLTPDFKVGVKPRADIEARPIQHSTLYQQLAMLVAVMGTLVVFSGLLLRPSETPHSLIPARNSVSQDYLLGAFDINIQASSIYFAAAPSMAGIYPSPNPVGHQPVNIKPRPNAAAERQFWMPTNMAVPQ